MVTIDEFNEILDDNPYGIDSKDILSEDIIDEIEGTHGYDDDMLWSTKLEMFLELRMWNKEDE